MKAKILATLLCFALVACNESKDGDSESKKNTGFEPDKVLISPNPADPLVATFSSTEGEIAIYGDKSEDGALLKEKVIRYQSSSNPEENAQIFMDTDNSEFEVLNESGESTIFRFIDDETIQIVITDAEGENVYVEDFNIEEIVNSKNTNNVTAFETKTFPRQDQLLRIIESTPVKMPKHSTFNQSIEGTSRSDILTKNSKLSVSFESCGLAAAPDKVFALVSSPNGDLSRYYNLSEKDGVFESDNPIYADEFSPAEQATHYANTLAEKSWFECENEDFSEKDFYRRSLSIIASPLKIIAEADFLPKPVTRTAKVVDTTLATVELLYCKYQPSVLTAGSYALDNAFSDSFSGPLNVQYVVTYGGKVEKYNRSFSDNNTYHAINLGGSPQISNYSYPTVVIEEQSYEVSATFSCAADLDYTMSIVGTDEYEDSISGIANEDPYTVYTLLVPGAEAGVEDTITIQLLNGTEVLDSVKLLTKFSR